MGGIKTSNAFYGRGVPKNWTGFAQLAAANYQIVQPPVMAVGMSAPYGVVPGIGLNGLLSGSDEYLDYRRGFRLRMGR